MIYIHKYIILLYLEVGSFIPPNLHNPLSTYCFVCRYAMEPNWLVYRLVSAIRFASRDTTMFPRCNPTLACNLTGSFIHNPIINTQRSSYSLAHICLAWADSQLTTHWHCPTSHLVMTEPASLYG